MKEQIEKIKENSKQEIMKCENIKELNEIKVKYLGKKGKLTVVLRGMGTLSPEERPVIGSLVNQVRDEKVVEFLDGYEKELKKAILVPGKLEKQEAVDNLGEELLGIFREKMAREIANEKMQEKELSDIIDQLLNKGNEKNLEYYEQEFGKYYHEMEKRIVRNLIIYEKYRPDGRKINEIRPISAQVDVLPVPHGSALFTRGETQSLATVTLGSKDDEQIVDGLDEEKRKKFILHYNFPPYSGHTADSGADIQGR